MSKKTRLLIALAVIELLLGGIWFWLASFGAANPDRVTADFQTTIGQTMGAAMGALFGFGVLVYFIAARNDAKR
jgi:hypothetical protein